MKSNTILLEKQKWIKKEMNMLACHILQWKSLIHYSDLKNSDLDAEEYADNLVSHLDNARSVKIITLTDLNNVLHGLTMAPLFKNDMESMNSFVAGEYIAAFWVEDTTYEWYLGVTDDIQPNNTSVVSCFIWADTKAKHGYSLMKLSW